MSACSSTASAPSARTRSAVALGPGRRRAVVHADDAGALLGGADGDLGAEAGAGAGDDDGAAVEAAGDGEREARGTARSFGVGVESERSGQTSVRPPSM